MKRRTIEAVLRNKINKWIASIEDEKLREHCEKDTVVTGGCIASMLLGKEVNDIDIYFKTIETTKRVAIYYMQKFEKKRHVTKGEIAVPITLVEAMDSRNVPRLSIYVKSAGVEAIERATLYEYFESQPEDSAGDYLYEVFDELTQPPSEEKPPFEPVFLSPNAISLRGGVQIIVRFYGQPHEIHDTFDFTHCTCYWESSTGKCVLPADALEALLTKTLVYRGSYYPVSSIIRTRKFIERGWRINAGQYLKMIMQVNSLDLGDLKVLEEQLTGVDVAYFQQVIDALKEKGGERIDKAYLVEIIDRMF